MTWSITTKQIQHEVMMNNSQQALNARTMTMRVMNKKNKQFMITKSSKNFTNKIKTNCENIVNVSRLSNDNIKMIITSSKIKKWMKKNSKWTVYICSFAEIKRRIFTVRAIDVKMKKMTMNIQHIKKIENVNVKIHFNLKIIKYMSIKWIVNKKINKTTFHIEMNNMKIINKLICKKIFNKYEEKKSLKMTPMKNIEQCFNCYQCKHIDKMYWKKTICKYCVEKHKPNKYDININQHSIKCGICEKKHMTWSFKCLKRQKVKQNHRQKCKNNRAVQSQNNSFNDQTESKNNEKCLFNKQQYD